MLVVMVALCARAALENWAGDSFTLSVGSGLRGLYVATDRLLARFLGYQCFVG